MGTRPLRTVRPKDPGPSDPHSPTRCPGVILVGTKRTVLCASRQIVPLLDPVRSRIGAEVTALRAPHTRSEPWHRNVIRPGVDVDLGMMTARTARARVLTHVASAHPGGSCRASQRCRLGAKCPS